MKPLLTPAGNNTKIAKNSAPTWSLNLAPARSSGIINLCPHSTKECRSACLDKAGRNQATFTKQARQWRTEMFVKHRIRFLGKLYDELHWLPSGAGVRLNALSDFAWEADYRLFDRKDLVFYDYTKNYLRTTAAYKKPWPDVFSHYDLTYSIDRRHTPTEAKELVRKRKADGDPLRVAMVVHKDSKLWSKVDGDGWIDGDINDWRPGDPSSSIVLLRPKGAARQLTPNNRGFVKP